MLKVCEPVVFEGIDELDVDFDKFIREMEEGLAQKELGAVGAAYFIRQFSPGNGDYTAERDELLDGITIKDIIEKIDK